MLVIAPLTSRSSATGRAACCGWSRSSKSRRPPDASPTGRCRPGDVPALLDAGFLTGGEHPLRHGPTDEIPWLARQQRRMFARVGVIDPLSVADHRAHGGLVALERALAMAPADLVAQVTASGLRGRGGAGFPTGIKWQTVLDTPGDLKFICCNADEGDSGTYADRMLMEGDPFLLIEGMVIAAHAVGASEGFIYIRSEYPAAVETMRAAILSRRARRLARRRHPGHRPAVRPPGPGRSRRVHLRRGDLDAREPRGQARPDPARSRHSPRSRGSSASRPSSTTSCPWRPFRTSSSTAPRRTRRSGWAARAGPRCSSLGGNIAHGGIVEAPVRAHPGHARRGLRWRHPVRSSGPGRPGRRTAWCVPPDVAVRPADGLRGVRGRGRDDRPRRRGRLR